MWTSSRTSISPSSWWSCPILAPRQGRSSGKWSTAWKSNSTRSAGSTTSARSRPTGLRRSSCSSFSRRARIRLRRMSATASPEIRDNLPAEMKEPVIKKLDPNELPIVSLALTSQTMTPAELTILADPGITKELRGIVGVAQVNVSGGVARTIAVNVRPPDLAAAHVGVADVVNALNSQNLAAPGGQHHGRPDGKTDPLDRTAADAAGFSPARRRQSQQPARPTRPGGGRAGLDRRGTVARVSRRPARDRTRHHQDERGEHGACGRRYQGRRWPRSSGHSRPG